MYQSLAVVSLNHSVVYEASWEITVSAGGIAGSGATKKTKRMFNASSPKSFRRFVPVGAIFASIAAHLGSNLAKMTTVFVIIRGRQTDSEIGHDQLTG
ncbi:MAG: hypothetical protein K2X77_06880 [Candidatus Obscuribacterales bacterium]|jgi:uncharacterized SAM-dependent methyltransferase|nr:hypothetical protein [Candidatus Obscuribacterales bacterium]